ncbi:DNA integrity scanning protein DisA [Naumannella sp. ID2617S]|nr:DNA integrity scanning protein DisA [Naumannella sp. ID2617S]
MAPGTPLREGLERILRGRTGALVVLGTNRQVEEMSTGGFRIDVPFTATALRELAKMDGAIVLTADAEQIVAAGVHLSPDPTLPTVETGTRHRTADRLAQQTGLAVVTVSASMNTIQLFLRHTRTLVENSEAILSRAHLALQTLERYKERLLQVLNRLSGMEVQDQVTVRDLVIVAQRLEMVRRLAEETGGYVNELGTDGRLLELQLLEVNIGLADLPELLAQDYRPDDNAPFGFDHLPELSDAELVDASVVARAIGFTDHLESRVSARGYRQLASINRLPAAVTARLVEQFGNLQQLFGASSAELQLVEGVGESRARMIRDSLTRLAEAAYTSDPLG